MTEPGERTRRQPVETNGHDPGEFEQADYLPDFYGEPVAAGPEIDTLDARSQRLEGGRYRRPVPTGRQADEGMEYPDVEPALEKPPPEPEQKAPLGDRVKIWADAINPAKIPGPKMPLFVFAMMSMLAGWDDAALGILAPELRAEFGFSIQLLATLGAVTGIAATLLGIPAGYLVDRVKRVWLIRIGAVGGNVSTLLRALAPTGSTFIGAQMVGLGSGIVAGPAGFPLMTDYYPSRARARLAAVSSAAGQLGGFIGPLVAGLLIVRFGWRPAVFWLSVMALAVSLVTFLLKEPVRGGIDRLEMGVSREEAAIEQPPPTMLEAFRNAWSIRTLRRQAYAGLVIGLSAPINLLIGLIMAERFLLDPFQRALIGRVGFFVSFPALLIGGAIADRLLTYRPATLVVVQASLTFVNAGSLVLMAFAPSLALFILLSQVPLLVGTLVSPASFTITSLVIPARVRGLGMQVFTPFSLIGMALGPVLVGFAQTLTLQQGLLFFVPLLLIGGAIQMSAAATVERDIRAARAAALAEKDQRESYAGAEAAKLLVCRDVDVAYDGVQVLFNVDLDVTEGECLALVGTNGSGKSTLLRSIAGLQEADNGAIFFGGRDITHAPAHENARNGIVMMPGGQAVFPTMTVRENLTTAAWMTRNEGDSMRNGIDHVLDLFPVLRERYHLPAGQLSGGEQQMLALGQAFLMRPRLLMIDELSLGLAPQVIERLLGILREISDQGTTIIIVEQSVNVALTLAERAVFMEKGNIVFDGPTEDLLRRPDLVRSIFMGGAVSGGAPRIRRLPRASALDEPEELLSVKGVAVSFGGVHALRDVSLALHAEEIVGIIGPNGAGKTTLFDVISGYLEPDAGRVVFDEQDVTRLSPDARARLGLGRAFQNAKLFPPLTVRENIAIALERRAVKSPVLGALWLPQVRASERRIAARVDGYIEILGLMQYADKFVRELSTGTRRAVEIACIMAAEPKVLLLDEPSSGLAQAESEALGPALVRLVRETGCSLLVIEHDLPLITSISDRMVGMELGAIAVVGTPDDVTSNPRVLQSYLAASNDVIERSGSRIGRVLEVLTDKDMNEGDGDGGA